MNKILKTMLPIAGVACVAAPLATMTSCNKHECKFEKDTIEFEFGTVDAEIACGGFAIKNPEEDCTYEIKPTSEAGFTGTCSKAIKEKLSQSEKKYSAEFSGETAVITCFLEEPLGKKLKAGEYFSVSFNLICRDKDSGKERWTVIETLTAKQIGDKPKIAL